jgi:hypothetical protein
MSEEILNQEAESPAVEEEQLQESQVEETPVSEDETIEEAAKAKAKEEEYEEESVQKEEAPKVNIPKTKAGTIQAAVDMLKAAKKEDAQRLFAKMIKVDEAEEEDSLKSSKDAENMVKPKSAKAPVASGAGDKHGEKVKAKIESVDFDEDLDVLIAEEATLSDGFKEKAGTIFEAVLTSKLTQEVDRLESEYASNLEEEVKEINDDLVEKVNAYLDYVVENWMKENELAVTNGLRTEIAEEFMTSLQKVFTEHYIEVPEGKVDLVDELNDQVNELEESLNKTTEDNVRLHAQNSEYQKAEIVREQSSGLAETEAEKLASLVEDVEFEDSETFENKVKTIRDSYFKGEVSESVDEVDSLLGEDNAEQSVVSESMARYTQAINKHIS